MKNKFLKNCLALFLITLVAGVSLAFVNEITKEGIAKAQDKARLEAYEVVYPDAQFEALDNTDEILKASSASLKKESLSQCTVDDVLKATDKNGNLIGYVFSATSPSGYGGDVKVAIGVSAKTNQLTGFTVLSHSETAGLGAKATEDDFKSQFVGKSADGINYTKNGASSDNEIDALSGATITSNAVCEAVDSALAVYNNQLKEVD